MIKVYTDGSCSPNPGKGGWGVYIEYPDGKTETLNGGRDNTTNNQMELMAAIKALGYFEDSQKLEILTDSQYVRNGITQWILGWERNGWRTSNRKPVKNAELWQELNSHCRHHSVKWTWIRGHNGNYGNERADQLASLFVHGENGREPEVSLSQRVSELEKRIDALERKQDS